MRTSGLFPLFFGWQQLGGVWGPASPTPATTHDEQRRRRAHRCRGRTSRPRRQRRWRGRPVKDALLEEILPEDADQAKEYENED